ncbi:MAG: hypothetical protein A3H67_00195 [Candidatus Buchananbacteria bacterium RIFCSPLOWO2_02_FULL_46_11b]|uniref:PEP-utilising enzyme mobile domain-containing protein n=1 Tax=Candidatus Buchananbacteria bacterium RIFCSPLOWO2_02_FULL_46_11b TaxID=1797548 RepID=A0A1G1YXX5_9BACT|nr:MAG: hypothetical protein A3H67_00195 [Candidatus Buchananbacteria bacterium RIFCSPLOWO2_02_FULL_46_11b]
MNKIIFEKLGWEEATRKGVNFEILLMSLVCYGWRQWNTKKKRYFGPFYTRYYRQIDGHRDILKKDISQFIRQVKERERQRPGSIYRSYRDFSKVLLAAEKFATVLPRLNFSQYSNQELAKFLTPYANAISKTIWYDYNYVFLQHLGQDLYQIIRVKIADLKKQSELFDIFTLARQSSMVQQEQKAILQLVRKIKEQSISLNSQKANQLISRYLKQFAYLGYFYFRGRPWVKSDILNRLKSLSKINPAEKISKLSIAEKNNKNWQTLAKQYSFDKKELLLIKTIKEMTYCTNLFDEVWSYWVWKSERLLSELQDRLKVSKKELIEMDLPEINNFLLLGRPIDAKFKKIIRQRFKDSAYLMINNQIRILSGEQLKHYRQKVIDSVSAVKKVKILKGQPASAGSAKGRVALVFGISDLKKVKKGDILVSKATLPSFMPAMERASAIIAEVGGLLSHAAIVSRELKIPCVVGIKFATKVLKDGDLVEVDANKGVVRKLK